MTDPNPQEAAVLTSIRELNRQWVDALKAERTKNRWRMRMATEPAKVAAKRGFAAMSPEKQREIASKGGKASHGGGRKSTRLV